MAVVSLHDFVKVASDRADGKGMARVTKVEGNGSSAEAELVYDDGKTQRLYTAFLFKDMETHRRRQAFMAERASKIGTKR